MCSAVKPAAGPSGKYKGAEMMHRQTPGLRERVLGKKHPFCKPILRMRSKYFPVIYKIACRTGVIETLVR